MLLAGGLAFALVGWRVLDLERTERERRAVRDAGVAVARGKADAERLASAPRGRPVAIWRIEPLPRTTADPDAAERLHWQRLRRAAALEADPARALAQYEALLHPSQPTWVKDVASLRVGVLLNGRRRYEESRRHLARAAEASPLLLGIDRERVRLMALRFLALDAVSSGETSALRRLLDEAEDGARLGGDDVIGPARIVIRMAEDMQRMQWARIPAAERARLERARARAERGLALLRVAQQGTVVVHEGTLLWRGTDRLALYPPEALMEAPPPGLEPAHRLVLLPAGGSAEAARREHPGAVPLDAPLERVLVVPRPPSSPDAFGLWIAVAFGLGLLAYAFGAIAAVRGWRRSARAVQQQAHFTAAVSHEMKTPIASVRAMAELLADAREGDVERTRLYGERIDREMQRLATTVRNVLDAAHIERGTLPVQPVPSDPAAWLERLARSVRPVLEGRGFAFTVRATPAPALVPFDAQALDGVLLNLVDNAAKFSGERRAIELEGEPRPHGGYRIRVLDRGVGLGPGDPQELFGRYNRGAAAREGAVPGVGLGLHIARQVIEAHGGRLRARNRPQGGAVFEIDLPGGPAR